MNTNRLKHHNLAIKPTLKVFTIISAALSLMGCYVDVYSGYDTNYDYTTDYSDITDMSTQFVVDAALLPVALAAEAPYQIIDPDAYTSERSRSLARASITETTYAYLFDNVDCDQGGFTQVEAEANTTSYDDGYTYVDIQTSAQAYHCEVWRGYDLATIDSHLVYDSYGWYDDVENKLSSIDSTLDGDITLTWGNNIIRHQNIEADIYELSSNDFAITINASTRLSDGYDTERPSLVTTETLHWSLGDQHPHQGEVAFIQGLDTVTLSFKTNGVWRQNSQGYAYFWTWQELGY